MSVPVPAAVRPSPVGRVGRGASLGQVLRRAGRAAPLATLPAIALAFSACAQHTPREFDVTRQVTEERLPPPGPAAANLAGNWELDPRAGGGSGGMERGGGRPGGFRGGDGPPGGGGGEGGFGGMPPGEGARGGRGREGGRGRRPEGGDSVMAGPRALVVQQTDSSLSIARPGGAPLTLYFDGRTVYAPDPRGDGSVETNGRWHAQRFEVRRRMESGRSMTESYELSKDGTTLTVRATMGGGEGGSSFEARRVYRRVAEGSVPADPAQPPARER